MRTVVRLLGLLFVLAALFVLGADLAAADAGEGRGLMPLGQLWYELHSGSLNLTQAVVEVMKEQRSGSIVMINSQVIREVMPTMGDYAASKGALLAAARTLARELGEFGIRVNTVLPSYIWGASVKAYFEWQAKERGITAQEVYDEVASRIALGRIPTSEEIAGAVVFFASDLSEVVTGQTLDVNGGEYFG